MKKKITYNSYTKAYQDLDFLRSDEARSIRLQLEMLKPQIVLYHSKVKDGIVCFGSARIQEKAPATKRVKELELKLKKDPKNVALKQALAEAKGLLKLSRFYDDARALGRMAVEKSKKRLAVITGGGPGIMEAANRGASEAGGKSIGFNITLPHEQKPNPYISKNMAFSFHYFAIRKMHLVMRAEAVVVYPGGFGTFDEMFEILTLVQTGKHSEIPIILVGKEFWNSIFDFEKLLSYGVISHTDRYVLVDNAKEAWAAIEKFYKNKKTAKSHLLDF